MRTTLLATIAAIGLTLAVPALADSGSTPNIPSSAAGRAVTVESGAHYQLAESEGGGWVGNDGARYTLAESEGGGWVGNDGARYTLAEGEGGGWVGNDGARYTLADWVGNQGSSFHQQQA